MSPLQTRPVRAAAAVAAAAAAAAGCRALADNETLGGALPQLAPAAEGAAALEGRGEGRQPRRAQLRWEEQQEEEPYRADLNGAAAGNPYSMISDPARRRGKDGISVRDVLCCSQAETDLAAAANLRGWMLPVAVLAKHHRHLAWPGSQPGG